MATLSMTLNLRDGTSKEFSHEVGSELVSCDLKRLQQSLKTLKNETNAALSEVVEREKAANEAVSTDSNNSNKPGPNGNGNGNDEDEEEEDDEDDAKYNDDMPSEPVLKKPKT